MTDEGSGDRAPDTPEAQPEEPKPTAEAEPEVRKGPVIRDKRVSSRASSDDAKSQDEMKQTTEPKQDDAAQNFERLANERLDDLQRLKAEFENYRKRILREQTEVINRASSALVNSLLPVLDNFDLAVAAAEDTKDFEKMLRGLELVYGELKEVLRAEGLEPIEARGRRFDPSLHEAALEIPGDEDGTLFVTEVLRPGYMFKGRILRPAMVKVTRKAEEHS